MFLLDTNVVSELRKVRAGRADKNVAAWADTVELSDLYLSAITIHETELGVRLMERRDGAAGARMRAWLDDQILPAFDGRIIPVDTTIALRSAGLHVPDPKPLIDGLIAATALAHGMTLVTRNVVDFATMGVALLNPWSAPE